MSLVPPLPRLPISQSKPLNHTSSVILLSISSNLFKEGTDSTLNIIARNKSHDIRVEEPKLKHSWYGMQVPLLCQLLAS
jgi:hypothetical protein